MHAAASQLALTLAGASPGVYQALRGPLLRLFERVLAL